MARIFPRGLCIMCSFPLPPASPPMPRTTALCLVYFTVKLAKIFAWEPNNTSKSGRPITGVSLAPCSGVTPL